MLQFSTNQHILLTHSVNYSHHFQKQKIHPKIKFLNLRNFQRENKHPDIKEMIPKISLYFVKVTAWKGNQLCRCIISKWLTYISLLSLVFKFDTICISSHTFNCYILFFFTIFSVAVYDLRQTCSGFITRTMVGFLLLSFPLQHPTLWPV